MATFVRWTSQAEILMSVRHPHRRALGKSLVSAFAARGSAAVATDSWTEF
ncbi:hypothetical protein G6L28_10210 [Agrobacterium larrymoorei]|nr:hypothetical protein [Agrobacterium larrymoorei]NTJ42967.1 hypothetical protein [Agrobacterium larrymoorei]